MSSNKKSDDHASNNQKRSKGIHRRSFVKLLPSIGAAEWALPYINLSVSEAQAQAQQQRPQQQLRVSKESLHEAEKLIGIELTSAHEDMALPNVSRNLTGYENLRKVDIP